MELWVTLERGALRAHQGLLVPLDPQPLLDHRMPRSPSMVSPSGSQQIQVEVGEAGITITTGLLLSTRHLLYSRLALGRPVSPNPPVGAVVLLCSLMR